MSSAYSPHTPVVYSASFIKCTSEEELSIHGYGRVICLVLDVDGERRQAATDDLDRRDSLLRAFLEGLGEDCKSLHRFPAGLGKDEQGNNKNFQEMLKDIAAYFGISLPVRPGEPKLQEFVMPEPL